MRTALAILLFCVVVEDAQAFCLTRSPRLPAISIRRAIKWDHLTTNGAPSEPEIATFGGGGAIRELIARAGMDTASMYQIFSIQGLLLNAVILSSLIFNIDVTYFATSSSIFDFSIWKTVLQFTVALLGTERNLLLPISAIGMLTFLFLILLIRIVFAISG